MKAAIISGSAREGSNSLRLSKSISLVLKEQGTQPVIIDLRELDIPMIGKADFRKEDDGLTKELMAMMKTLTEADMAFITSPEYNWNISPVLKNFLDNFGSKFRPELWDKKVFALAGVSDGGGGKMSANITMISLNKILSFAAKTSVISPKIFWSRETDQNIDKDGKFLNKDYETALGRFIEHAVVIRKKLSK